MVTTAGKICKRPLATLATTWPCGARLTFVVGLADVLVATLEFAEAVDSVEAMPRPGQYFGRLKAAVRNAPTRHLAAGSQHVAALEQFLHDLHATAEGLQARGPGLRFMELMTRSWLLADGPGCEIMQINVQFSQHDTSFGSLFGSAAVPFVALGEALFPSRHPGETKAAIHLWARCVHNVHTCVDISQHYEVKEMDVDDIANRMGSGACSCAVQ